MHNLTASLSQLVSYFARPLAITLRQFYLFRNSLSRLLPLFAWVGIDIVLWGYITKYLNTIAGATNDFVPQLLGAVLFWNFFIRVMQGITVAFMEDVWSRNFLNMFASPLTIFDYLSGLVMTSTLTSVIGLGVMLLLAIGVFGLSFAVYGLAILPFLLVLFLFGIALGIFGCAIVLRLGPAAEWFIWPIPMVVAPFAGVFYPLSTLPPWMQLVGRVLPPSYVFEGMRAITRGGALDWRLLGFSIGLTAAYIVLACLFFKLVYTTALRTGLIARYSAESVN